MSVPSVPAPGQGQPPQQQQQSPEGGLGFSQELLNSGLVQLIQVSLRNLTIRLLSKNQ